MTVTIAGSVETFDEARFVEGFARQMGVSAADVSVSVEAGSVLVTATVRYDSIAEARTGAERWADLPATDLGAAIGSSVERKGAGQVSEVFFNAPPNSPPAPPAQGNLLVIVAIVVGSVFFFVIGCVVAACAMLVWRRNRSELGVCLRLRDVQSTEQLRTSFRDRLGPTHFARFTGGWLVLPEHAAAHGTLMHLLHSGTVELNRAQPWLSATGLARVMLTEADDVLPVLLGRADTLDLLLEDAYLVVRFSALPRGGKLSWWARLWAPRPATLANAGSVQSPRVVFVEPPKQTNMELRETTQNTTTTNTTSEGSLRRATSPGEVRPFLRLADMGTLGRSRRGQPPAAGARGEGVWRTAGGTVAARVAVARAAAEAAVHTSSVPRGGQPAQGAERSAPRSRPWRHLASFGVPRVQPT